MSNEAFRFKREREKWGGSGSDSMPSVKSGSSPSHDSSSKSSILIPACISMSSAVSWSSIRGDRHGDFFGVADFLFGGDVIPNSLESIFMFGTLSS